MKKIYIFAAVLALLTLSLNAQYSQNATKQKQAQRVEKSKDTGKAVDVRVHDLMSGTKDAPANAVSVPYYNHMTTDDEFAQLGTYDANGDANDGYGEWGFYYTDNTQTDTYARYYYSSDNAANDYLLIAVPVILQAGKHYRFSMDVATGGYTERYEVVMFDELTTTGITSGTQIIPVTSYSSSSTTRIQSEPFTVSVESYMYFAVHCVSAADMYYLQIDNIAIEADDSDDLSVAISAPGSVHAGETANVTATVTNNGSDAVQGYTVNITANGNVIFTQTVTSSLSAGASATYTVQYPATSTDAGQNVNFGVEVVYTDDDPSNNTAAASMYVLPTPPPVNVAATPDGNSGTMTWDAPIIAPVPGTLIWDFEEEADFTAFTTIDADNDGYNWYRHENTGSGNYTTNSGNGVMASESYHNDTQTALSPNNWLISPEVTLGGTLTFWAAHQATYPENFAVYVCAGPYSGVSSFTKVYGDITTTANMTEHTIDLSAYQGQGYIAIRHYGSTDNFILLIDDIAVEAMVPGEQPTSYNIYLEGQLVGYVDANTFTYTFNNLSNGTYNCAVSAVYPGGYESEAVPTSFTINTTNPTIEITPETQTISDAAAGSLTVTGTDINGNINVSVGNDWSVNPTSLGNTGGDVSVSYTGRDLSATTTVTATAANDNTVTDEATVNYVADLYIVGDYGSGWNFSDNSNHMTYNNGTYTATITVNANAYIVFARLLGNDNPWNTRDIFGPVSEGNWGMQGDSHGGNIDLYDDDPIYFPEGGTYTITINSDGTFTITKQNEGQTAPPVITYQVDDEYVTITATGDGTVTLNVPGYDPVSGEGEVSITIPRGYASNTITVTATAQESGKDESDPTYRDITIPAGSDWVEMDGTYDNPNDLLSFLKDGEDIMLIDQFVADTKNNSHPDHYTYTLRQTVNGETQTSTPVTIPVYKTSSTMQGLYTQNQVTGDTDMKLKPNVVNTEMDFDVNPDRNVLYYSLYRGDKNAYYPEITAQSRVSQLQKFEEMVNGQVQYFMFENHQEGIAPRYDHVGNQIVERLDTNWVEAAYNDNVAYVPVIWTFGLYTARGDGKNNSYGSDIKREYMGQVTANITGQISDGAFGTWEDINGTTYRAFHPTIVATGYLPQNGAITYNDEDQATYVPFMCRAWCTNEGIHDYGRDADGNLMDLGELPTPFLLGEATFGSDMTATIGGDWTHGSVRDPWSFALPASVIESQVTFKIRFYYKKVVTEGQQNGGNGKFIGGAAEEFFMAETEGNANDMIVGINEFMNGIVPVSVTYVNPQGMQSSRPFDGVNIVVTRYSDGTTRTSKIIR